MTETVDRAWWRTYAATLAARFNATKAFVDSFSFALRAELRGTGVTVTCLMRPRLWQNRLQSAIANITPAGVLAEEHRRMAEPGSGGKANP